MSSQIRLRLLATTALICCVASGLRGQETKQIFNGKDLSGWKGNPELWSVEDGAITGTTTAEKPLKFNTFLVWEESLVGDFELNLDYRIGAEGNSGIQYRSTVFNESDFVVGGYQADIDATMKFAGINYEEKGRGILAQRGQRVTFAKDGEKTVETFGDKEALGDVIKKGEWNHYKIVAKGPTVSHYINDQLMSEVIDHQVGTAEARIKKFAKVSGSEVSKTMRAKIEEGGAKVGEASSEGVLAFQIHVGPPMKIEFKNIALKTW
ncbi:MAG: DUF1080 domain-containing protein [Pirellulaceae bacterium]